MQTVGLSISNQLIFQGATYLQMPKMPENFFKGGKVKKIT